jgi:hypothetical protein
LPARGARLNRGDHPLANAICAEDSQAAVGQARFMLLPRSSVGERPSPGLRAAAA